MVTLASGMFDAPVHMVVSRAGARRIVTVSVQSVSGEFVRRWLAPGVSVHDKSIAATGFDGQFWMPPAGSSRRPALLEFGGSEGGPHG